LCRAIIGLQSRFGLTLLALPAAYGSLRYLRSGRGSESLPNTEVVGHRATGCADFMRVSARLRGEKMSSGTVKWFNKVKGFGFIQPSDGGQDVFVHITAVERAGMDTLVDGQKLTYDIVNERGKNAATNLKAG